MACRGHIRGVPEQFASTGDTVQGFAKVIQGFQGDQTEDLFLLFKCLNTEQVPPVAAPFQLANIHGKDTPGHLASK